MSLNNNKPTEHKHTNGSQSWAFKREISVGNLVAVCAQAVIVVWWASQIDVRMLNFEAALTEQKILFSKTDDIVDEVRREIAGINAKIEALEGKIDDQSALRHLMEMQRQN